MSKEYAKHCLLPPAECLNSAGETTKPKESIPGFTFNPRGKEKPCEIRRRERREYLQPQRRIGS